MTNSQLSVEVYVLYKVVYIVIHIVGIFSMHHTPQPVSAFVRLQVDVGYLLTCCFTAAVFTQGPLLCMQQSMWLLSELGKMTAQSALYFSQNRGVSVTSVPRFLCSTLYSVHNMYFIFLLLNDRIILYVLHNSIFCYKNKICNCMFSFNKQLLLLNKCVHCTWRREMWC